MKKFLFLLVTLPMFVFTACSDDDEDVNLTTEQVVGKWNVTWAQQDGKSLDVPKGTVYMNLKSDGTYKTVMFDDYYIGEWELDGNTVVGTTTDPITERYRFTSFDGKNAEIDYTNSVGDNMKFRATKADNSDDMEENEYFKFPAMDWGISKNSVKSYMYGYDLREETGTSLIYNGKIRENSTGYMFENGKLVSSAIEISSLRIGVDDLIGLLKNRFNYLTKEDDIYYFLSKDKNTAAVLTATIKDYEIYYLIAFTGAKI